MPSLPQSLLRATLGNPKPWRQERKSGFPLAEEEQVGDQANLMPTNPWTPMGCTNTCQTMLLLSHSLSPLNDHGEQERYRALDESQCSSTLPW